MFLQSMTNKQLQAFLILLALSYQLVLPALHYGHGSTTPENHKQSTQTEFTIFDHQSADHPVDCTICQMLSRAYSPGLVSIGVDGVFKCQPLGLYPLTDKILLTSSTQKNPPQRGPPIIS